MPMYHSVQDVVLVVCVWVGLNQWAIWELIERERGKRTRKPGIRYRISVSRGHFLV